MAGRLVVGGEPLRSEASLHENVDGPVGVDFVPARQ